jgi:RNA polymerase sporulation-specific sigma factor
MIPAENILIIKKEAFMNHHEIESCVIRAKAGDTAALLALFDQYEHFIIKTANGIFIKNYDPSDLLHMGYITIINAVINYKIGNHAFSSYAYTAIKNTMYYILRSNKNSIKEISLNQSSPEAEDVELMNYVCQDDGLEEPFFKRESIRDLRSVLKELDSVELELIIMVYYSGCTMKK